MARHSRELDAFMARDRAKSRAMRAIRKATPETGQASLIVELRKSRITVRHGSAHVLLFRRKVSEGFWDRLWHTLKTK